MIATRNLVEIKVNNGTLIYHKWFGNPIVIDDVNYGRLISNQLNEIHPDLLNELIQNSYIISDEDKEFMTFRKSASRNIEPALTGKKIKQLDLIVSQRCNLGCPHCIYYAGNERENTSSSIMDFSIALDSWEKYLKQARENNVSEFDIHFGGAEPLTNWTLVEKVLNEFPNYLRDGETIIWSMNTNVTLVTDYIADVIKEHNIVVHTSLDGNKEANDAIRMKLGGQGTFDIICEKISLLKKKGIGVIDLSMTITSENFDLVNLDFVDWLKSNGIQGFGIDIDLVGSPNISAKEASKKITDIFWKCYNYGIECSGTWMTAFLNIINRDIREDHVAFCGAVKGHNISVTPTGELTLCAYMSTRVGHLNNWDELFQDNSKFQSLLTERQPGWDPHCSGCILEGSCGGQCHITREVAKKNNQSLVFETMCDFYRDITTTMLTQYCNFSNDRHIIF